MISLEILFFRALREAGQCDSAHFVDKKVERLREEEWPPESHRRICSQAEDEARLRDAQGSPFPSAACPLDPCH